MDGAKALWDCWNQERLRWAEPQGLGDQCLPPGAGQGVTDRSLASHRQRAELEELRRQLEESSAMGTKALREEYERVQEEQERRHQV